MEIEFEKIDHIHIYVTDRSQAEIWYQNILGMQRVKEYEFWAVDGGPLTISNGGVHLALFTGSKSNTSAVAMKVTRQGFDQMRQHLNNQNVDFHFEDHDLAHSLYLTDPDGNEYEVTTYDV
tara:strand:+ start:2773 stop:3135 length:363 start_codon:yes stop_codon:yes gene_type:complete